MSLPPLLKQLCSERRKYANRMGKYCRGIGGMMVVLAAPPPRTAWGRHLCNGSCTSQLMSLLRQVEATLKAGMKATEETYGVFGVGVF
jgi:hypothetical protein